MAHATPSSEITLSIENAEEGVCVSVINQGEPIEDKEQDALFEPFYRIGTHSADRRHSGLGLAISRGA